MTAPGGFKRVTCSVCKIEVNKAQTYSVGPGKRACKSHEGVSEIKDSLQKIETLEKQRDAEKAEQRRKQREIPLEEFQPGKIRCAVCQVSGLRSDAFFTRVLVERSKATQIYGVFNPFDPKHPGNQLKIADRCVFVLEKAKILKILHLIRGDYRQILDLVGVTSVCGPCCNRHKIDPLPAIPMDEVVRKMAFVETFVTPVIDAMAREELARDN